MAIPKKSTRSRSMVSNLHVASHWCIVMYLRITEEQTIPKMSPLAKLIKLKYWHFRSYEDEKKIDIHVVDMTN